MAATDDTGETATADGTQRFLFENADIRGERVLLDASLKDMFGIHQYAPGVAQLLGELLTAAVLLRSTLKFEGRLILQARSTGQIPLLMAECSSAGEVRGIARGAATATATRFDQLLGDGTLAITVDPLQGQRYQGIVPLSGDSLAHCLDAYFARSEQLGTRLWLAAGEERAGGLLLQQLPAQLTPDAPARDRQWEHVCALAATVKSEELLLLPTAQLLHRLYHREELRLFPTVPVRFRCSCSPGRTLQALSALDPAEIESLLKEQGSVTMDCEFCNQRYRFLREDLAPILEPGTGPVLH